MISDQDDLLTEEESSLFDEFFPEPAKPKKQSRAELIATREKELREAYDPDAHYDVDPELKYLLGQTRTIADSNLQDMMEIDEHGAERFMRISDMPREVAGAISSIKVKQVGRVTLDGTMEGHVYDEEGNVVPMGIRTVQVEVKLWDKLKAMDMLMRYHGAYEKDNAQKSDDLLESLVSLMGAGGLPEPKDE